MQGGNWKEKYQEDKKNMQREFIELGNALEERMDFLFYADL
jgi:hypothetical protein